MDMNDDSHRQAAIPTAAVDPIEPPSVADFPALFGNDRPVEMEIGCGKGGFLLDRARSFPDRNFFAIEWANQYFLHAVDRMARWRVPNVRIMRTDARTFVERCLPERSLAAIYVFHPDPWPKRRHHRRRLFRDEFVVRAARAMQPDGVLAISTDHEEYFHSIIGIVGRREELKEIPFRETELGGGAVGTNFETKYLREGRAIHYAAFARRSESAVD
jgi:tRNA (guanine-N7-)-methyltransferase